MVLFGKLSLSLDRSGLTGVKEALGRHGRVGIWKELELQEYVARQQATSAGALVV